MVDVGHAIVSAGAAGCALAVRVGTTEGRVR
jgi:hypothetical protein